MKLVIINGSPRKSGSTAHILNTMREHLEAKDDTVIHFYQLSELDMRVCKGCCYCFEHGKCIYDDDAERLSNDIADADGLIIGSPTYASNVSGLVKTFIDRGHLVIEQLLKDKYAVGVVTSENYGGSTAASILKNVFVYSGAHVSTMINHKLPFSSNPQFTVRQEERFKNTAEHFYQDMNERKGSLFQKLRHSAIFNFGIKPFVVAKGIKYQGVLNRWAEQEN